MDTDFQPAKGELALRYEPFEPSTLRRASRSGGTRYPRHPVLSGFSTF